MAQISLQLQISFESLVEAIVSLAPKDKLQLRQILDQEIAKLEESDQTAFLQERGCVPPVKFGLQQTLEPFSSERTDISVNHDQFVVQPDQIKS